VKLLFSFFCLVLALPAAEPPARAVPTFECLGLYWDRAEAAECRVRYRAAGSGDWREGYPLAYGARERQYRGSLVGLTPDTAYEIRLEAGGETETIHARTRGENFPIGKTTHLPARSGEAIVIQEGGTAQAWHLVAPAPETRFTSDVFNLADANIVVEAAYVILRGLELKGAGTHGVLVRKGVQNVVIEDCRITGWGRLGGARVWGVMTGGDSAIYAERGAGRLVIQRNLIEYPRSGSNDWESGHPSGPQAISLVDSSGGNIIRYNTIRSTDDHGFNDGIGGAANYSLQGSPNRDSDIYGNIVSHCWDDAIESEGANMNVRIWSNYLHHTFVHIASAATSIGPLYIFRNVFGSSRISHLDPSGGTMLKTGTRIIEVDGEKVDLGVGRRFIFHNTALQPGGALNVFSSHPLRAATTRNNLFYARGERYPKEGGAPGNDFAHDLTGGPPGGLVQAMFLPAERAEWFLAPRAPRVQFGLIEFPAGAKTVRITDPLVDAPNPAIDRGVRLPGFNDDFTGAAPDIGAYETGRPALRFGREAAPGFTRAPWELR
jgi:hypothetical protein